MSIQELLNRIAKQTAVYWGSPVAGGYGANTYADPVEILIRWEEATEMVLGKDGKEIQSRAQVYTLQDVDEQGYLYLGELTDLDSDPDDPLIISGAWQIIQFQKTPEFGRTDKFIRKAYLSNEK